MSASMSSPTDVDPHWTYPAVQDLLRRVIAHCEHAAATATAESARAQARDLQDAAAADLQRLRLHDDQQLAVTGTRWAQIAATLRVNGNGI